MFTPRLDQTERFHSIMQAEGRLEWNSSYAMLYRAENHQIFDDGVIVPKRPS